MGSFGRTIRPDQFIHFSLGLHRWVGNTMVHGFGHAFGLADRYKDVIHEDDSYTGIMKALTTGDWSISTDDIQALKDIYKTHTKGLGW